MQPEKVLQAFLSDLIEPTAEAAPERHESQSESPAIETNYESRTPTPRPDSTTEVACPVASLSAGESAENQPIQVLRFKLRGVELAIPLSSLDSILRWDRQASVLPGQPCWQRGVKLQQNRLIRLVDLAALIMPERLEPEYAQADGERYLLIVGGARFGLICDQIMRPQLLNAEDVRWSGRYRYRPWAKAVLKRELAVLLDVDALLREMGMENA